MPVRMYRPGIRLQANNGYSVYLPWPGKPRCLLITRPNWWRLWSAGMGCDGSGGGQALFGLSVYLGTLAKTIVRVFLGGLAERGGGGPAGTAPLGREIHQHEARRR